MAKELVTRVPKTGRANDGKAISLRGRQMAGNSGDGILVTYQKRRDAGEGLVGPREVRALGRVAPGGR